MGDAAAVAAANGVATDHRVTLAVRAWRLRSFVLLRCVWVGSASIEAAVMGQFRRCPKGVRRPASGGPAMA